jgi:hypothetical protein
MRIVVGLKRCNTISRRRSGTCIHSNYQPKILRKFLTDTSGEQWHDKTVCWSRCLLHIANDLSHPKEESPPSCTIALILILAINRHAGVGLVMLRTSILQKRRKACIFEQGWHERGGEGAGRCRRHVRAGCSVTARHKPWERSANLCHRHGVRIVSSLRSPSYFRRLENALSLRSQLSLEVMT